jgi:hypothetical protein
MPRTGSACNRGGWEERKGTAGVRGVQGGEMAPTMYMHMNKWIKKKKKEMSIRTSLIQSVFPWSRKGIYYAYIKCWWGYGIMKHCTLLMEI